MVIKKDIEKIIENISNVLKNYITTKNWKENDYMLVVAPSGYMDNIHVILGANVFENISQPERDKEIWTYLDQNLQQDMLVKISMLLTMPLKEFEKNVVVEK